MVSSKIPKDQDRIRKIRELKLLKSKEKEPLMTLIESYRILLTNQIHFESDIIAQIQSCYTNQFTLTLAALGSALGTHHAFVALLPPMFWFSNDHSSISLSRIYGLGLLGTLAWSTYFCGVLKDLFMLPRPVSPPVVYKDFVSSVFKEYGMPSTHTSNSTTIAFFTIFFYCFHSSSLLNLQTLFIVCSLFLYTIVVAGGRVLYGVHSFVDVISGFIVGMITSLIGFLLLNKVESFVTSSNITVPFLVLILSLLAIVLHPQPADPCPCFKDSVSFLAAWTGGCIGTWYRCLFPISQTTVPLEYLSYPSRMFFGSLAIVIWSSIMKPVLMYLLPILSNLWSDDDIDFIIPTRFDKFYYTKDIVLKYSNETLTRIIVYIGIGFLATCTIPATFYIIGM